MKEREKKQKEKKKHKIMNEIKKENGEIKLLQKGRLNCTVLFFAVFKTFVIELSAVSLY